MCAGVEASPGNGSSDAKYNVQHEDGEAGTGLPQTGELGGLIEGVLVWVDVPAHTPQIQAHTALLPPPRPHLPMVAVIKGSLVSPTT